jgi:hypothetical protein
MRIEMPFGALPAFAFQRIFGQTIRPMKPIAVLLAVLTVSPFTVPFRTCGAALLLAATSTSDRSALSSLSAPDDDDISAALVTPRVADAAHERTLSGAIPNGTRAANASSRCHRTLEPHTVQPSRQPSSVVVLRI